MINTVIEPEFKPVFIGGKEGYNVYRIPAIIKAQNNDLLAVCEGRKSMADAAENNFVLKRSRDNGRTWDPLEMILSDGRNSLNNPCLTVVEPSGKIILIYQVYPYPEKEFSVKPGLVGEKIMRCFMITSLDHGKTWSKPQDITKETKRPTTATTASGPGIGIQIKNGVYSGRIIIPFNQRQKLRWHNYAIFSDDEGKTWQMSNLIPNDTFFTGGNETQIVERSDGSLLMNSRSWGPRGLKFTQCRRVSLSQDGGLNWGRLKRAPLLIDSQCMGSIISYRGLDRSSGDFIIFSNPASIRKRIKGTIRLSVDGGQNWAYSKTLVPGNFAYSCLVQSADGSVGCLYETGEPKGYERIEFARFSVDWIQT
jgi:sialidase-1